MSLKQVRMSLECEKMQNKKETKINEKIRKTYKTKKKRKKIIIGEIKRVHLFVFTNTCSCRYYQL